MIRSIYVPAAVRGNLVNASPISFGVVDPRCEMGVQITRMKHPGQLSSSNEPLQ